MRERPIIFNTEMVRAIMEGRKTQTRRVIKRAPYLWQDGKKVEPQPNVDVSEWIKLCHYGQVGDRLWVRETWAAHLIWEAKKPRDIPPDYAESPVWYVTDKDVDAEFRGMWRPSIHMPRWASRITLEITGIRVERLQEITDAGAVREGIPNGAYAVNQITSFARLWDSLNEKRGYGWDVNPFVWCISFKKLD